MILVNLPLIKNTVLWLNKRTCCDRLWIKNAWKVSSFHFIFHSILNPVTLKFLRSLWAPHSKIYLKSFSYSGSVIPSQDICDQRILQSNWLKAFPAITQEQKFPQIWDLYSKIDKNINFYFRNFPARIDHKIFQNKGKIRLLGHFWSIFFLLFTMFYPKNIFPKKSA